MQLVILDLRNQIIANLNLSSVLESANEINYNIILFEDFIYRIEVHGIQSSGIIEPISLFIGDEPVDISMEIDKETGEEYYSSENAMHFLEYYGLAELGVSYEQEGERKYLRTEYIQIATRKLKNQSIESMLNELEQFDADILEACFSETSHEVGQRNGAKKSLDMLLQHHQYIVKTFKSLYVNFQNNPHTQLKDQYKLLPLEQARNVDARQIAWLSKNPYVLRESKRQTGISYDKNYYVPIKMLSMTKKIDNDTYENIAILTFLKELPKSLNKILMALEEEQTRLQSEKSKYIIPPHLGNNYELTTFNFILLMLNRLERQMALLQKLIYDYHELYESYVNILYCRPQERFILPHSTPVFSGYRHYNIAFQCMMEWWVGYRDFLLEGEQYILRLKKVSKIFEFYCLVNLIYGIQAQGYLLIQSERFNYGENEPLVNNIYTFQSKYTNTTITLFYEPLIYSNPSKNKAFDLYKLKRNEYYDYFAPDFLIKYESKDYPRSLYGILDAKFSTLKTIRKITIKEVAYKYLLQIGSTSSHFNPILYMWLMYPGESKSIVYEQKGESVQSVIYPSLAIVPINPKFGTKHMQQVVGTLNQKIKYCIKMPIHFN